MTEDTTLKLLPLTVVAERGEYIIGDPASGRFFAVPKPAVRLLDGLREGMSVGEAAEHASSDQARIDGLDFADVLLRIGFVIEMNGSPVPGADVVRAPQFNVVAARLGRVLFSRFTLVLSGLSLLLVFLVFAVRPGLRPGFEDLFVDPQPGLSFGIVFALGLGTGMLHELCHWWAARSLGVPARIRFGRRLYIPVMETDVSGLWGLPASLRYGPFLAGMQFDILLLLLAVGTRLAWSSGLLDVPPLVLRLLAALVAIKIFELMFQCLVFLRTDLYAVMITTLGVRNLARVSRLRLKHLLRIASSAERAELAAAHPRDLAVSRWYVAVYLAGLIWAVWFFKTWFYPSSFVIFSWMGATLTHAPFASGYWWQAVLVAALVSSNIVWPVAVYAQERLRRRKVRSA